MPPAKPFRSALFALACAGSLAGVACNDARIHAVAPVRVAPVAMASDHPMNVAPDTAGSPPVEVEAAPPAPSWLPPEQLAETLPSSKPPAPRKQPESETAEVEPARAPAAPQIAPQLSPVDQASYQHKTLDQIAIAEQNLQRANGKRLNAAQQDLVEKIRSFLGQSRDAAKSSDWIRAQNLAQKAQLLSAELINSL
jgi:hypothetical protein